LGDEVADVGVAVGGDGGYLGDFGGGGDGFGVGGEEGDDAVDGGLGASSEVHGVAAGCDVLDTFRIDGACENGGGGGTVASDFVGLGGYVLDETARR
jgi:hypothetical protein